MPLDYDFLRKIISFTILKWMFFGSNLLLGDEFLTLTKSFYVSGIIPQLFLEISWIKIL